MAEQKDINNQDIQNALNNEDTPDKKIIVDGEESEDKEILPEDISLEGQGEMQAEEAEGTPEDEEGEENEENAGKGFFKKKDKKQEVLKQKVDELEDRVRRQMAEFDNFRKRTDKEKTTMFETGAKSIIEKILPVVDNFERGLATIPEEEKGSGFAEGMQMIYKQLMTELDSLGVKPIEAIGQEFNPDYHNAVMQVESEEYETGVIAQELLKGYMYRDTVVRHSMVAVVS